MKTVGGMMRLGQRFKAARLIRKLSARDAGRKIGYSESFIYRIEDDRANKAPVLTLVQLASIYRCNLSDLLMVDRKRITGAVTVLIDGGPMRRYKYKRLLSAGLPHVKHYSFASGDIAVDWMQANLVSLIIVTHSGNNDAQDLIEKVSRTRLNSNVLFVIISRKNINQVRKIAKKNGMLFFDDTDPDDCFISLIDDALRIG